MSGNNSRAVGVDTVAIGYSAVGGPIGYGLAANYVPQTHAPFDPLAGITYIHVADSKKGIAAKVESSFQHGSRLHIKVTELPTHPPDNPLEGLIADSILVHGQRVPLSAMSVNADGLLEICMHNDYAVTKREKKPQTHIDREVVHVLHGVKRAYGRLEEVYYDLTRKCYGIHITVNDDELAMNNMESLEFRGLLTLKEKQPAPANNILGVCAECLYYVREGQEYHSTEVGITRLRYTHLQCLRDERAAESLIRHRRVVRRAKWLGRPFRIVLSMLRFFDRLGDGDWRK